MRARRPLRRLVSTKCDRDDAVALLGFLFGPLERDPVAGLVLGRISFFVEIFRPLA
jgi:hypothetical protein